MTSKSLLTVLRDALNYVGTVMFTIESLWTEVQICLSESRAFVMGSARIDR